jgi:hypothetical protein
MNRTALTAALVAATALVAVAQEKADTRAGLDLKGKLYRSVFTAGADVLTSADVAALPEPIRARLTSYLSRRTAFRSNYKNASENLEMMRTDAKKRALEKAIVSLLETPGIERQAADFVAKAPIAYEWHGVHDGPLAEATYAEAVLKKDPSSPLAPFLYLLIAQRQRVVFEVYDAAKNDEGMKAAAARSRAFAQRARGVDDPIFAAVVEDMDRQPYLYLKGAKHPRDLQ